jgi:hypothetical protein
MVDIDTLLLFTLWSMTFARLPCPLHNTLGRRPP